MCVALLQCKHHRFTATLLKLQHASLHATNDVKWSLWLPDPGWAASLWTCHQWCEVKPVITWPWPSSVSVNMPPMMWS